MRAGLIVGQGLLGLVLLKWRKRKLGLAILGATGALSATLYPEEAKATSHEAQRLGRIAINFVQGVKPGDVLKKFSSVCLLMEFTMNHHLLSIILLFFVFAAP